jgi:hypothetical protein
MQSSARALPEQTLACVHQGAHHVLRGCARGALWGAGRNYRNSQHVFGTVWFNDNESWAYRDEYDGSEWWAIQSLPEIPEELK